ncbi:hypothetical protein C9374_007272 [Naegleria lovaniensis]|uniref:thioredoxin-dependent peroxiredoxin n=1 Tax=Naegleria lovaniensis TaxID=51637 RepID=A0AA88KS08_NAELO|nr:uncharacterized protein C9374_007272 [Naegleria lovaniensis]KAG2393741.1 hypothetical protein C9374_007272 [Naegleria lovaniensis]
MTPRIQKPAPSFSKTALLPDGSFGTINLSDYKGKYVILFFYPLDFTFVCPTEIIQFSDRVKEFEKLNTQVIGVSVDSEFTHLAWTQTPRNEGGLGPLKIPLISDLDQSLSREYGVLMEDGTAVRGTFLIDDQQVLRQITVNDMDVGRNVDEILRLVQAFQYVAQHGEVCPAGWQQGKPTMKANPKDSREYFEKVNNE